MKNLSRALIFTLILLFLTILAKQRMRHGNPAQTSPTKIMTNIPVVLSTARKAAITDNHRALIEPEFISVSGGETDEEVTPEQIDTQLEQIGAGLEL